MRWSEKFINLGQDSVKNSRIVWDRARPVFLTRIVRTRELRVGEQKRAREWRDGTQTAIGETRGRENSSQC